MTDIRFYHLQRKTVEQALPPLLQKIVERGLRAVVMAGSEERVEAFNQLLWTWDPAAFLPHGSRRDGLAEEQPVWLTAAVENPNGAQVLVLTDGTATEAVGIRGFTLVCDLFDGNDEAAVQAARGRWSAAKAAGHVLSYWQQGPKGWAKQA